MAERITTPVADPAEGIVAAKELALLRNDLRALSKAEIGELVADLTARMGVDPSLAPIDLIPDRSGPLRIYINARGAAEIAKRWDISDDELSIDIRPEQRLVLAHCRQSIPYRAESEGRAERAARSRHDVGAQSYDPERPDSLARAVKHASTSAHRRTTLALVGIFLTESEDGPRDA